MLENLFSSNKYIKSVLFKNKRQVSLPRELWIEIFSYLPISSFYAINKIIPYLSPNYFRVNPYFDNRIRELIFISDTFGYKINRSICGGSIVIDLETKYNLIYNIKINKIIIIKLNNGIPITKKIMSFKKFQNVINSERNVLYMPYLSTIDLWQKTIIWIKQNEQWIHYPIILNDMSISV